MSEGFVNSSKSLVPEFLPTDVRFFAVVVTRALRGAVGRMAAISKKDALVSGTDLLRIESTEVGFLKLYATNGSIFMRSNVHDVTVRGEGDITVPSKWLSDVLKLAKTEHVTLSCVGFELQVTSGNDMWRIQLPNKSQMPAAPEEAGRLVAMEPLELKRILSAVVKSAADGFSRTSLTQVKFDSGYAISCDGPRMHRVHSDALEGVAPFTIPTLGVRLFLVLLNTLKLQGEVGLRVSDSSVTLVTGDEEISMLRTKVAFPDVENIFISQSVLNDTSITVSRTQLQEAVTKVKVFADAILGGVSITSSAKAGDKHIVFVHSKDEFGNFSSTEVPITIEGKAVVDLKLNYKHLQDALDSVTSDIVIIRVAKSSKTKKTSAFIEDLESGFVAVLGQIVKEN